jgi:hypothetical protein
MKWIAMIIPITVALIMMGVVNCENKPTPIKYVVAVYQDTIGTFELQSFDPDVGWYFRDGLTVTVKR